MADRKMSWVLAVAAVVVALVAATGLVVIERAFADGCGSRCKDDYSQCRMATKGSESCEKKFTKCLQRCIKKN